MSRAKHFKEARTQRLREIPEDYTEMISDLIQSRGEVRVCDLAREMGISHVSVLKSVKKLIRDGYLTKNQNQAIELTAIGEAVGTFSKQKHEILLEFLLKLGVPEQIAAADVEGMEHHISKETLQALTEHLQKWEIL